MLVNIVNEQVKTEDVTLCVINDQYDSNLIKKINKKVKIILIGRQVGSRNPFPIIWLNLILLFGFYDIIHVHHPAVISYLPCKYFIKRIVLTLHSLPLEVEKVYYIQYHRIYAISEAVQNGLRGMGLTSEVVYNGVKCDSFSIIKENKSSVYQIVQIGRLIHQYKGQDLLINAIGELVNNSKKIHCDIIGDGPSYNYLKGLIERKNLCQYVTLKGNLAPSYIQKNLCNYDLFVQPSRWEGFGLTIVEAMSAKVPVLVANIKAPMEVIGNGRLGFYFMADDSHDLALRISNIMANREIEEFIDNAYDYAKKNYDVKQTALKYLCKYNEII